MTAERIAWGFESAVIREQLRIRKQRGSDTVYPPEREVLDRRPAPHEQASRVLEAIRDLGTCRQIGMALGPIPITAIWEYVRRKGYDDIAAEIMISAILEGDRAYLAGNAKKALDDE